MVSRFIDAGGTSEAETHFIVGTGTCVSELLVEIQPVAIVIVIGTSLR